MVLRRGMTFLNDGQKSSQYLFVAQLSHRIKALGTRMSLKYTERVQKRLILNKYFKYSEHVSFYRCDFLSNPAWYKIITPFYVRQIYNWNNVSGAKEKRDDKKNANVQSFNSNIYVFNKSSTAIVYIYNTKSIQIRENHHQFSLKIRNHYQFSLKIGKIITYFP